MDAIETHRGNENKITYFRTTKLEFNCAIKRLNVSVN